MAVMIRYIEEQSAWRRKSALDNSLYIYPAHSITGMILWTGPIKAEILREYLGEDEPLLASEFSQSVISMQKSSRNGNKERASVG